MKFFTSSLLVLLSLTTRAQSTYNGTILDKESKEPLPYVNIGIVGRSVGTVSNIEGNFRLELDKTYDKDSLRISIIGYKALTFQVAEFKNVIKKNPNFQLEEQINELEEFTVSSKGLKEKVLGNKTTSKSISGGFTTNNLGNEVGIRIKIKKSPTYIEDFNVSIVKNEFDRVKFRLNFYDIKNGLPNKIILDENIIIESEIKEGVLTVDLSKYNIVVYEDFFVSLEWIEDLGDSDGLSFSAGFLGSPIITRSTSQANWEKIGAISIGFNVTAKY